MAALNCVVSFDSNCVFGRNFVNFHLTCLRIGAAFPPKCVNHVWVLVCRSFKSFSRSLDSAFLKIFLNRLSRFYF